VSARVEIDDIGRHRSEVDDVCPPPRYPADQPFKELGRREPAVPAHRNRPAICQVDESGTDQLVELGIDLTRVGAAADVICLEDDFGFH